MTHKRINSPEEAIKRTEELFHYGLKYFGRNPDLYYIHVAVDIKGVSRAGTCAWTKDSENMPIPDSLVIRYNRDILTARPDDFDLTIKHEVSHALDIALFPKTKHGHGREWRDIMKDVFGISDPKRAQAKDASLNEIALKRGYKEYVCDVCGERFMLSKVRQNKMAKGHIYHHTKDNGKIIPVCGRKIDIKKQTGRKANT